MEYLTTDTELQAVANAIRGKTGGISSLAYPDGFVSAIQGIGSFGSDSASASDIRNGKKALVGNGTVTGNMTEKADATYNLSASNQTIAAGQYLAGAQTIRGVATQNLTPANVRKGVTVYIGDTGSVSRIASVVGTCEPCITSMPQSADCYVPFMFKVANSLAPSFYRSGNYFYFAGAGSSPRAFMVPCTIRMTYYPEDTSTSATTYTFYPNTWYTLGAYTNSVGYISAGGTTFHVHRVVKWETV